MIAKKLVGIEPIPSTLIPDGSLYYEFIKKNNIFGNKNIGRIRFNVSETDEDISDELDINELFKEEDEEEMTDDEFLNAHFRIVRNQ